MIYCATWASIGWYMFLTYMPEGNKVLAFLGFVMYVIGMIAGQIVEDRLVDRIKKLEKGNKNEV